jgi:hypothetical protein
MRRLRARGAPPFEREHVRVSGVSLHVEWIHSLGLGESLAVGISFVEYPGRLVDSVPDDALNTILSDIFENVSVTKLCPTNIRIVCQLNRATTSVSLDPLGKVAAFLSTDGLYRGPHLRLVHILRINCYKTKSFCVETKL